MDSIAGYAFSNCSALTSIVIPDNVEVIDDHAFSDCEKLVSLTMGKKVRKIDYRAFDDCTALDSVYWNAEAFSGNGKNGVLPRTFRKIVFGESVEYVPVGLCEDNANLTMVRCQCFRAMYGIERSGIAPGCDKHRRICLLRLYGIAGG